MKIVLTCMKCTFTEGEHPSAERLVVEMQDDGLYLATCSRGHQSLTCLQEQKFEVLFDLALAALHDGYYREAVTTATSTLERFYEFSIEVACLANGVSAKSIADAWKAVAHQSERQLGAFIFCYLMWQKEAPDLLKTRWVEFRNRVVHKGFIPQKDEARAFLEQMFLLIVPVLMLLKGTAQPAIEQVVARHLFRSNSAKPNDQMQLVTLSMPTIINVARALSADRLDFPMAEATFLKGRRIFYS